MRLRNVATVVGLVALAGLLGAAGPAPIVGRAYVVDGDTLTVAGVRIRIWGIDAPEGRQTCQDHGGERYACGKVATARMRDLVAGVPVSCVIRDHDQYGRSVLQCRAGGQDLGAAMVTAGLAVEYRVFDQGTYAAAEAAAKRDRRGLWAGRFELPSQYRADARAAGAAAPQDSAPPACVFKGNISASGRRIVHAPGQQDYAATVIDEGRGERWFCSLEAAEAAGWSRARR